MLYVVAFRWTEVTGGENGLGGISRPDIVRLAAGDQCQLLRLVASIAFLVVYLLWRFHRSPAGTCWSRSARTSSARVHRLSDQPLQAASPSCCRRRSPGSPACLLLFNNRMTSADPISVAFSGELLAMVVIGGMRSFLGPALGALFFVLFRDYLSGITRELAVLVRPAVRRLHRVLADGPGRRRRAACWRRSARQPSRTQPWPAASIGDAPLPEFLKPASHLDGPVLKADGIVKHFGGIKAVRGRRLLGCATARCTR